MFWLKHVKKDGFPDDSSPLTLGLDQNSLGEETIVLSGISEQLNALQSLIISLDWQLLASKACKIRGRTWGLWCTSVAAPLGTHQLLEYDVDLETPPAVRYSGVIDDFLKRRGERGLKAFQETYQVGPKLPLSRLTKN